MKDTIIGSLVDIARALLRSDKRNHLFTIFILLQITTAHSPENSMQVWERYIAPHLDDTVLKFLYDFVFVSIIFTTIWILLRIGKRWLYDENIYETTYLGVRILSWLVPSLYVFYSLRHWSPFSNDFFMDFLESPQMLVSFFCVFFVITPANIRDLMEKRKWKKNDYDSF